MSGQIVDASLVAAPKQRNTEAEKADIKAGRIPEVWQDKPAKLRQKGEPLAAIGPRTVANDARWTLVLGRAREREDGTRHADIVIPVFGWKSHASIDRRHGFIRRWQVSDAAAHDGRMLRRGLLDRANTSATVWGSKANEAFMERHGFRSQVHHRKPRGRPMAPHIRRGNASRSNVRAGIEHVFAQQKDPMALCIRTIGIGAGEGEDRPRQPHLQHQAAGLAPPKMRLRMTQRTRARNRSTSS